MRSEHRAGVRSARAVRSYLVLPDTTELLMIVLTWAGRLEIVPVLVVFTELFRKR